MLIKGPILTSVLPVESMPVIGGKSAVRRFPAGGITQGQW